MPSVYVIEKNGRQYAYRSVSYWDKNKKAPRSRQEYLGRVDENGNIIPKKKASVQDNSESGNSTASTQELKDIEAIRRTVESLQNCFQDLLDIVTTFVETNTDDAVEMRGKLRALSKRVASSKA